MLDAACMVFQLTVLAVVTQAPVSTMAHATNVMTVTRAIAVGAHSKDQSVLTVRFAMQLYD